MEQLFSNIVFFTFTKNAYNSEFFNNFHFIKKNPTEASWIYLKSVFFYY